ncbi:MAG: heparinase [Hyphococcus sp.]|nr:MAG: heparinase [Marinicaulis sp.]
MARAMKKNSGPQRNAPKNVLSRMQRVWGESPFYQAKLKGPAPDRLLYQPIDPFSPDKELAKSFARGWVSLGDETLECEGEIERMWDLAEAGRALMGFLQEFSWLRHVSALGDEGRVVSRALMKAWLDRHEKWSADAWDPYYVSERLMQLCSYAPMMLSKTDAMWRSRVLTTMARQTRHLALTAHRADTGFDRLMTSLGLSIAGYCLPGCDGPAERGLEMARRELRLQLRADGGHVSRNPSRQLKLAVRLQTLLKVMESRGFQPPGFLRHTVTRVSAMAEFFRCADGGLAVFNGGYEDDRRAVISIYEAAKSETGPIGFARHSGYHKLSASRALAIVDTGDDVGAQRFKSSGSFHFSSGRSRIIVNCGNGGHRASDWRFALEQPAAHSTLSFDGKDVSTPQFSSITHRRSEDVKGQLLELERRFSNQAAEARYQRRLYLSSNGADLRGEENLIALAEHSLGAAVWRFHLHPGVKASLARDRRSVILLLGNKEGWRFKSNCPELFLEKSIYCGGGGAPVASEQIALMASAFPLQNGQECLKVKWALQRLDGV